MAGPKRPQDRVALSAAKAGFAAALPGLEAGAELSHKVALSDGRGDIGHGDVVIAAITSCTNTSNPNVMLAAGLVAQKAVAQGLKTKPWVKTSLAPGRRWCPITSRPPACTRPLTISPHPERTLQ